ncbi:NADH-ubiquinone oxidoreductase 29.9 kd subunit precursor [Didymella exigua CBS 183.55]|uniref:NADH-ubiquinone oxidoreductase 29.9 kd subunit n=1 Tax=Didymella exigua CBS 183.55 TaxID=1150837 RepID=A0A6A5RDN2_9PLEO|nr:NADH-ubiquinone oxidoreductase 29.9 kd subunit precursor [Didymella exigua CBS 183.55]KAF1925214.1 NADH-ubiquinone oxidoreductase 29.9 kd subunit precursor [Didymella exigua CBS 183.55]
MRAASRLFAAVKPGQFLEAGAPTGLTGLATHPSPRSTLLHHYHGTLTKLQQIPESSVYRQSTEALTRHRLKIIEESKPKGWDAWQEMISSQVAEDPEHFHTIRSDAGVTVVAPKLQNVDYGQNRKAEWDGEVPQSFPEGIKSQKERRKHIKALKGDVDYKPERTVSPVTFAPEPRYTIEAISDLENKIGAGLIEEVIQVAEAEHTLVEEMIKSKVWEPLEEPSPEGQWVYAERGTHTGTTQNP